MKNQNKKLAKSTAKEMIKEMKERGFDVNTDSNSWDFIIRSKEYDLKSVRKFIKQLYSVMTADYIEHCQEEFAKIKTRLCYDVLAVNIIPMQ